MKDNNKSINTMSIMLLASACFMIGLLISQSSEEVYAGTAQSSGTKYIINSASLDSNESVLYVLDSSSQQIRVFTIERKSNNYYFEAHDSLNLANLSRSAQDRIDNRR